MAKKLQPHEKRFLKGIVVTIFILLLPFIYYQPKYEHLKTTEITVSQTYYKYSRQYSRRTLGPFIWAADDTGFLVRGKLPSKAEFEKSLIPGTIAQIKYYRGLYICIPFNIINEVTIGNDIIVPYHNTQGTYQAIFWIGGGLVFLIEFSLYASSAHLLKRLRKRYQKWKKCKSPKGH